MKAGNKKDKSKLSSSTSFFTKLRRKLMPSRVMRNRKKEASKRACRHKMY